MLKERQAKKILAIVIFRWCICIGY